MYETEPHVLSKRVQLAVFMAGSRAHCVAYTVAIRGQYLTLRNA